jgi:DNA-binding NarL/FixJ family response regulator
MGTNTINPDPNVGETKIVPTAPALATATTLTSATPCYECAKKDAIIQQQQATIDNLMKRISRLKKLESAQRGRRARSKKVSKLLENTSTVFTLKNTGFSNRKIANLFSVSETSIRRVLAGDLNNWNDEKA